MRRRLTVASSIDYGHKSYAGVENELF